jgi:phosphocarrier protein HPr
VAEGRALVKNSAGIHVRPSGVIREKFLDYPGTITLKAHGMETEVRNVMGLIGLGLQMGDTVTVCVEGPDDKKTCAEAVSLFETKFDFPPRK